MHRHDDVSVAIERQPDRNSRLSRVTGWVTSLPVFVLVFVPLAAIYISTANLSTHDHIDPLTNAVTGWHIGMTGSVVLPDHVEATAEDQYGNVAWIVESQHGPVSQYPPGAAAWAAPFYLVWREPMTDFHVQGLNRPDSEPVFFPLPDKAPAAVAAALATAAAVGLVAAAIPLAGASRGTALAVGYISGLATTMWSTASDSLWQHGPAALGLALGIYLIARNQLWWAGLSFGAAVMTRPPTAVIAAVVGLWLAWSQRAVLPAFKVGVGAMAGLAGLLWYNFWLWGELTITGGYGSGVGEQFVSTDAGGFLVNLAEGLIDPSHGLLVYAPFLVFLLPGLISGWRRTPDWGRGAAVAAVVYLLVQFKANRSSGGTGFLGYRYPLEALTVATTLLAVSYVAWVDERPLAKKVFWVSVGIAFLLQVNWKLDLVPIERLVG